MRRYVNFLPFVLGILLLATACYEDKSKDQTEVIPRIRIEVPEAIAQKLSVVHGKELRVEGVRISRAGVENPEGLQYEWTVSSTENNAEVKQLATSREFHEVIDLPISTSGYLFVLTVTDPQYDLQSQYKWTLYVTAEFGEGILLAYTDDDKNSDVELVMHPQLTENYSGDPKGSVKRGLLAAANGAPLAQPITRLLYSYDKTAEQNMFWVSTREDLMRIETDYYKILSHKEEIFVMPPQKIDVQLMANTFQCTMILNDGQIYEELLSRDRFSTPNSTAEGMSVDNGILSAHTNPVSTARPSTIFYDKAQGKFCYGYNRTFAACSRAGTKPFDPGDLPGLRSVAGGMSVDGATHVMLMKNEAKNSYAIYSFENTSKMVDPKAKMVYELPQQLVPHLEGAVSIFFSLRDPVLYVATPEAIYKTVFEAGSVQFDEKPVFQAPAGEHITLARLYLQGYYAVQNREENATLKWSSRAVVVVTSKDDRKDRLHVIPQVNFGSGQLDPSQALVFDGLGRILDFTVVGLYK